MPGWVGPPAGRATRRRSGSRVAAGCLILAALAVEVMADGLQSLFPLLAGKAGN